ncbi:helicase HerA-like domain-containing protein [Biformimicrobium ophioploci]|uniref:DUF853 family protein n=1 Tax=Biformimicrobium ophioploci TaxID=3036711 RepID=A0ABQ6M100_9GAMM|nr:helicase HerA-like domain-containing protein [Microbulbifer sp. NKW57]GMG88020.1 DUF853 family protein [Microbulbifer sp. NKW57]
MTPIALGIPSRGSDSGQAAEPASPAAQLLPDMISRHGLVCGATGTGKTVTLRVLVEQMSARDIPVFVTDVKGDLSGLAAAGGDSKKVAERLPLFGLGADHYRALSLHLWGRDGIPLRTTPTEMGPELLAQTLGLNDNQTGLLHLMFKIADELGLLLLDWKDLEALINFADTARRQLADDYGSISSASLGAIKRKFLALERAGVDTLFGEPALDLNDLLKGDAVHLLDASAMDHRAYATLALWLLAELYEQLPEAGGELKLAVFFDEAHLLFDDMPAALLDEVEQVVRLIRSRGVGIFFVTQNPLDIPEPILAQLGNRVQHALRAYTPKEQRTVGAVAKSFRENPELDTAATIGKLGVGEALVSCLDENAVPQPVQRVLIPPPASRLSPLSEAEKRTLKKGPLADKYCTELDRESAYEYLRARREKLLDETSPGRSGQKARKSDSNLVQSLNKAAISFGKQFGRELARGILGALGLRRR